MNQFYIAVLMFAVPWALDAIVFRLVANNDADPIRDAVRAWDRRVGPRRQEALPGAVLFLPAAERRTTCRRRISRWQRLCSLRPSFGFINLVGVPSRLAAASAPPRIAGRHVLVAMASVGVVVGGLSTVTDSSAWTPVAWPGTAHPALLGQLAEPTGSPAEQRDWAAFRDRFIQPDGRVVDSGNQGVSHTESQGQGMLFAVAFDDRASFDRIWTWTRSNLRRGGDALHAWRYIAGADDPVPDNNNATDGDIYIAAALVRAAHRWQSPAYLRDGQAIARDILRLLVRDVGGRTVLLPGVEGFATADHVEVNLSYDIFPLLADLQAAVPSPTWQRLLDDGRRLVAEARFGQWQLPPDWLEISATDGAISLGRPQPPRFSYDAVRIPLFLAWDHAGADTLVNFASFWGKDPAVAPAWIDLTNGAEAPYTATGGMIAIADVATRSSGVDQADLPAISASDDYYSASLILLSRLALRESGR